MALKARNLYLDLDLRKGEACGSTTEDLRASVGKWNHEVGFKNPSFLATADPYKAKAAPCKKKNMTVYQGYTDEGSHKCMNFGRDLGGPESSRSFSFGAAEL